MHLNERQKVLVIDDERNVADTLCAILSGNGYECRVAYSAEESIAVVAQWEPALAIIDVILPVMSGIDLAILLNAKHPAVKLLLISGQLLTGTMLEEAANHGHTFDILAKPIPVPQMLAAAANLLAPPPGAE
ncbi:MAG TPA: response regulator [Terracidiphilus sp.]|jgi:DNA-binding NtrC family response regulator